MVTFRWSKTSAIFIKWDLRSKERIHKRDGRISKELEKGNEWKGKYYNVDTLRSKEEEEEEMKKEESWLKIEKKNERTRR